MGSTDSKCYKSNNIEKENEFEVKITRNYLKMWWAIKMSSKYAKTNT